MLTTSPNAEKGTTNYDLTGYGQFEIPTLPATLKDTVPSIMFSASLSALVRLAESATQISRDPDLSAAGKQKKLEPFQKDAVTILARADAMFDTEEPLLAKREADLYAVPQIHPSDAATAVVDREVRDFWRSQSGQHRADFLNRIREEPGKHERTMVAMLRSPVPQLDHEVQFITDTWRTSKRLASPDVASAIDADRACLAWARASTAHVAGITKRALQWDHKKIVDTLSQDATYKNSAKVFGIDGAEAAHLRIMLAHENRAGRTAA